MTSYNDNWSKEFLDNDVTDVDFTKEQLDLDICHLPGHQRSKAPIPFHQDRQKLVFVQGHLGRGNYLEHWCHGSEGCASR